VIQHRPSTSSLQHNVVLHSNIYESSIAATIRSDLNMSPDTDEKSQTRRKANSLMTVYEQDSSSDLLKDDSWHLRSPSTSSDVTHQRASDEKQMV
jgi:hypothetical protein